MQTTDLRNPVHKIISRPQNSINQFIRFLDGDTINSSPVLLKDLSAYNMFVTVRDANHQNVEFLTPIEINLAKEIKIRRMPVGPLGQSLQPVETGIYLANANGSDYKLIINQFPSSLIPVGIYELDWVMQYINGETRVLFTILWEITNVLPEPPALEMSPFLQYAISFKTEILEISIVTILYPA